MTAFSGTMVLTYASNEYNQLGL